MKMFYEVNGSEKRFGDICRKFDNLNDAKKSAEEMKRDGIRHVEVLEVTENERGRYAHTV